jgi:hypothetical protein
LTRERSFTSFRMTIKSINFHPDERSDEGSPQVRAKSSTL